MNPIEIKPFVYMPYLMKRCIFAQFKQSANGSMQVRLRQDTCSAAWLQGTDLQPEIHLWSVRYLLTILTHFSCKVSFRLLSSSSRHSVTTSSMLASILLHMEPTHSGMAVASISHQNTVGPCSESVIGVAGALNS